MRRFALFLLLAGSAVPAIAAADDEDPRPQRAQQSEHSSNAAEPRERPSRSERIEARREAIGAMRAQSIERSEPDRQRTFQRQGGMIARSHSPEAVEVPAEVVERRFQRRQRQFERESPVAGGGEAILPRQQVIRTIPDASPAGTVTTQHRNRDRYDGRHSGNHHDWSRNWRHDHRYDWRRWRDRNRTRFHLGFYFDPFGWNYRRYSIGSYMYPSYYSSRYWLHDPWSYRLPPAWGPYRWVRYHNDALLIDTWTGEVVDVIHNFFW